jgi:hypothetical protein
MADRGKSDVFKVPERTRMGETVENLGLDNALLHLLDQGLLQCVRDDNFKDHGYYRWTYLGKLAVAQPRYRTLKNG